MDVEASDTIVDMPRANNIEAKKRLENYWFTMRAISQEEKLVGGDKETMWKLGRQTLDWLDKNKLAHKDDFEAKQEELEGVVTPIMMKVYQARMSESFEDWYARFCEEVEEEEAEEEDKEEEEEEEEDSQSIEAEVLKHLRQCACAKCKGYGKSDGGGGSSGSSGSTPYGGKSGGKGGPAPPKAPPPAHLRKVG